MRIAYFVSSHGFGHAARACAVMQRLARDHADLTIDIFTETPAAFFYTSLSLPVSVHPCKTDVGLLQKTPLLCDIEGSLQGIRDFLDFDEQALESLATSLHKNHTDLIICDISPLGLKVAGLAGIHALLIENFTWDWIYTDYLSDFPQYAEIIETMAGIFASARWRIKTRPVCDPGGRYDLLVGPLCRQPRRPAGVVREALGIDSTQALVLLTQGGIEGETGFLDLLTDNQAVLFLVTGAKKTERHGNVFLMQNDASVYMPDYLNACDAVIGKLGYSTVAETWQAGLPMMYITRDSFRESATLARFVDESMSAIGLSEADYDNGGWLQRIDELLALPRVRPVNSEQGLHDVAAFIRERCP
ncbi:MAG: hypothetical protein KDJ38_13055 [Gammaproteobacteria bacterium]|nr:hypothetical protein [Gammaproteobacteria bacterium]